MIARQTKLKLLAFAALAVLGMSYLGFNYVGLDRVILGNGYDVAADFTDSGGIFVNAEVTYRGVAVGRVTDMQLVDDGVRVDADHRPRRRPDPGRHRSVRRDPQRGGGAVRRPPSRRRGRALSRGRLGHPGRAHLDPGPRRAVAAPHGRAGRLDRPGEPADRHRRARPGLRRGGRRPRPADRQRRPAPRAGRGIAAPDAAAHHRRPDRARHPGGEPLGDPAVGLGPAAGQRHPGRHGPDHPQPRRQRARRRCGPAADWWRTPARAWARWCATWTSSTT